MKRTCIRHAVPEDWAFRELKDVCPNLRGGDDGNLLSFYGQIRGDRVAVVGTIGVPPRVEIEKNRFIYPEKITIVKPVESLPGWVDEEMRDQLRRAK